MSEYEKIRILIAEDFDLLREDLADELNNQDDFEVVGLAKDGREIVELSKNTDFDIILMDVEMESSKAGIYAAETIIEENPDAKIIFLTAHETEEMIHDSMAVGPADYIIKGEDYQEVFRHIRASFEGEPVLSQQVQNVIMKEYSRLRESEKSLLFFINSVSKLTDAELELIQLLLDRKTNKEIAEIRCVELSTIKSQINSLLRKFGAKRTKEIVQMIEENNIAHLFGMTKN